MRIAIVGSAGLALLLCGVSAAPAAAALPAQGAARPTVVDVTIGTPRERSVSLSKRSGIPVGRVTFRVTNAGDAAHDFKVCTATVVDARANSCRGRGTRRIAPGQTANLTVNFPRRGTYEFLSTLPGDARGGLKGLLRIGPKATPRAGTRITLTAAGRTITARLNHARDFLGLLPATLPWFRNAGIEYITELEAPLSESGPFYTNVRPGDIVYYNPLDSVTIIYEETSSVPTLTKMGEITSSLSVFDDLPDRVDMRIERG